MSSDARTRAVDGLERLRARLQPDEASPHLAPLAEECDALIRAVEAFHMEAIRFRMYGLQRQLASGKHSVPEDTRRLVDEIREALQKAGFQIK